MSYTPGPWEAAPLTISYGSQSIQEDYAINAPDRWYGLAKVPVTVDGEPSEEGLANARLIAAAPDLLEGAILQSECGYPEPSHAYDEECVECWKWTHPDGRTWFELGGHDEPPPPHPVLAAAIAKAKEGSA